MENNIHVSAMVDEGVQIGNGSYIWEFARVLEGTILGENCSVGNGTFIGKNVEVGNNCKIGNGSNLYEGVKLGNNVFIGNNVSFNNVRYPRAYRKARGFMQTIVKDNVTVGANAVIVAGITIESDSTIGEGAIVLRNVSKGGLVVSPAAVCICAQDECKECTERKQKSLERHLQFIKKHA